MNKFNQQSVYLDDVITAHSDVKIMHLTSWTNENKAIGQQFDSGQ